MDVGRMVPGEFFLAIVFAPLPNSQPSFPVDTHANTPPTTTTTTDRPTKLKMLSSAGHILLVVPSTKLLTLLLLARLTVAAAWIRFCIPPT